MQKCEEIAVEESVWKMKEEDVDLAEEELEKEAKEAQIEHEEEARSQPEEVEQESLESAVESHLVKLVADVNKTGCVADPRGSERVFNVVDEVDCVLFCLGRDKQYASVNSNTKKCFCSTERPQLKSSCSQGPTEAIFTCFSVKPDPSMLYSSVSSLFHSSFSNP